MAEDKFYIDYMPGVWYGKDSDPPAFADCVVLLSHVETRHYCMSLAYHPPLKSCPEIGQDPDYYGALHEGWMIKDFLTAPELLKNWTVEQWLMLPAPFPDDEDEEGEVE